MLYIPGATCLSATFENCLVGQATVARLQTDQCFHGGARATEADCRGSFSSERKHSVPKSVMNWSAVASVTVADYESQKEY
jgi:hypothetical protein